MLDERRIEQRVDFGVAHQVIDRGPPLLVLLQHHFDDAPKFITEMCGYAIKMPFFDLQGES